MASRLVIFFAVALLGMTQGAFCGEDVLANGAFADGKSRWSGNGKIVSLGASGEEVASETDGEPAMAVVLSGTAFTEMTQRIRTDRDAKKLNVVAQIQVTPDFSADEDSPRYSKGNDWKVGGTWYWSAWVNPRGDAVLAVKAPGRNLYKTGGLKPGKTSNVKVSWTLPDGGLSGEFKIIFPPGTGTAYVRSVTATTE